MFKLFDESPSCCADSERTTFVQKSDFPLHFCSHRWIEDDVAAKKSLSIWRKMIEVLEIQKTWLRETQGKQKF